MRACRALQVRRYQQMSEVELSGDSGDLAPNSAPGKVKLMTLADLDGRTNAAKAARALVADLSADLGGADRLSAGERALVVRAAVTTAMLEHIETTWLAGGGIDLAGYATLANVQRRLLVTVGLQRRPRDVTPDLDDYVASRVPPPPWKAP